MKKKKHLRLVVNNGGSRAYAGTFWSVGEMKTLERMVKEGKDWKTIAMTLKRTETACMLRSAMIRTAHMFIEGNDDDDWRSWKKRQETINTVKESNGSV